MSLTMQTEVYPVLQKLKKVEDFEEEDEEFTHLVCELCYDPLDLRNNTGIFKYNANQGTDFSGTRQPDSFRNLKYRVHAHMQSKTHLTRAGEKEPNVKLDIKFQEKNKEAGMNLGRFAFMAVKVDHSIERYEDYVALFANKMPLGDINHGHDFCRNLTHSIFKCLHLRMEEYLTKPLPSTGRPTPIFILVDKYTPHRITGQIIAILAFYEGKMRDISFDYALVHSHTGEGLAEAIHKSLTGVFSNEHLRTRYCQY